MNRQLELVIFIFVVFQQKGNGDQLCWNGWARFDSACFKVFPQLKTHSEAQSECQSHEASLISIHSEKEEKFVRNLLREAFDPSFWIGLYSKEDLSNTLWTDGEPFVSQNVDRFIKRPISSSQKRSMCGAIKIEGEKWDWVDCEAEMGFICKQSDFYFNKLSKEPACPNCKRRSVRSIDPFLDPFPEKDFDSNNFEINAHFNEIIKRFLDRDIDDFKRSSATDLCFVNDFAYGNSCYHFEREKNDWKSAESDCQKSFNATLVTLNDWSEYFYVISKVGTPMPQFWVALKQNVTTWTTNEPSLFPKWWQLLIPSDKEKAECGSILENPGKDDHLKWENCRKLLSYMCEYPLLKEAPPTAPSEEERERCASDWTPLYIEEDHTKMCYKVFQDPKSWTGAVKHCNIIGGRLMYFDSPAKQEALRISGNFKDIMREKHHFHQFWIGLYQETPELEYEPRLINGSKPQYWDFKDEYPMEKLYRYCFTADLETLKTWNIICETHLPFICETNPGDEVVEAPLMEETEDQKCPNDDYSSWDFFQASCYKFVTDQSGSFWQAMEHCISLGGQLASIHSIKENFWIQKKTIGHADSDLWLGGLDITRPAGKSIGYHWIDGTPFNWINWYDKEPNNFMEQEHCLSFFILYPGFWNDANCSKKKGFICKKSFEPTHVAPTSSSLDNNGHKYCSVKWWPLGDRCVQFQKQAMKFDEARKACRLQHSDGELVSIRSQEEQNVVTAILGLHQSYHFIGLVENYGFFWLDQSSVSFTNWNEGEPNGGNLFNSDYYEEDTAEHCVEMLSGNNFGKWNDISCDVHRKFVCQKPKDSNIKQDIPYQITCVGTYSSFLRYRDRCYKFVKEPATWENARKTCQMMGSDLANIEDLYHQTFLQYYYAFSLNGLFWIGLKSAKNKEIFKWSDNWPMMFSNWGQLQPAALEGQDRCTSFNLSSGYWSVSACNIKNNFLCGHNSESMPTPDPQIDQECPHTRGWYDFGGSHCYYVEQETTTWHEALGRCYQIGGTLASIHSESEMLYIKRATKSIQGSVWLGITQYSPSVFGWIDGTPLEYTHWLPGEPNSHEERCVEMTPGERRWNDISCEVTRSFVCKAHKHRLLPKDGIPAAKIDEKETDISKLNTTTPATTSTEKPVKVTKSIADTSTAEVTKSFPYTELEDDALFPTPAPIVQKGLTGGSIAGIVFVFLIVVLAVAFFSYTYIKRRRGIFSGSFRNSSFDMRTRLETASICDFEEDEEM